MFKLIVWDGEYYIIVPEVETKIEPIMSWSDKNFNYHREVVVIRSLSKLLELVGDK